MITGASSKRSPLKFFVLVFALSIPLWVLGSIVEVKGLPLNVPVSVLGLIFVPLIAASILVYREEKLAGIKRLLKRAFDHKRIKQKIWYVPIIFLPPLLFLLTYVVMRLIVLPLPAEWNIPFLTIPILFIAFFIFAIGEELGWMGYAVDPMQDWWSALTTSIILGSVWAIWHYPSLIQADRTLTWIAWWSLRTVGLRVLIVWLYNNTGRSLFGAILFHAMLNVSDILFPNYGSHYDPAVGGSIIAITAIIVTVLWGSKTLARYRFGKVVAERKES